MLVDTLTVAQSQCLRQVGAGRWPPMQGEELPDLLQYLLLTRSGLLLAHANTIQLSGINLKPNQGAFRVMETFKQ